MSSPVQKCKASPCPALLAEREKLDRLKGHAAAADAVYKPPGGKPRAPEGFTEASDTQLKEMNLNQAMLQNPKNAKGEPTDFQAAVFINDRTGERVVAFKGTESGSDWSQNFRQGLGMDSYYYTQAQTIAGKVASSKYASSTVFTGHSLGGGLASAASRASGLPATTFNAATLKESTVTGPMCSHIDAVSVRGDPLTAANESKLGTTSGTIPTKLDPPDNVANAVAEKFAWYDLKGKANAFIARQKLLHSMTTAIGAINKRARQVETQIKANKCC